MFQFLIQHYWILLALIPIAWLCSRAFTVWVDHVRIRKECLRRAEVVQKIRYAPLSKFWMSPHSERIYKISLQDPEGQTYVALCKISWISPPFWRENPHAKRKLQNRISELELEVARLQEQLNSIEKGCP